MHHGPQRLLGGGGAPIDLVAEVVVVAGEFVPEVVVDGPQEFLVARSDQGPRPGDVQQIRSQS
ncbi:hypothetical protein ACGFYV_14495 [Streptomyces sp. NPDC048297]|uniref:hypothetical protein n=1 Tax=Streptomyces sp. NPDC048297 TaxID=3365531 RepID=UPI003723CD0E